jgi:hypothetical protein
MEDFLGHVYTLPCVIDDHRLTPTFSCLQSSVFIKDGNACITDYGLVPIMAQFQDSAFPNWSGEAVRWADPSIWLCNASASCTSITRQSDIYAFGCIVLQVRGKFKTRVSAVDRPRFLKIG